MRIGKERLENRIEGIYVHVCLSYIFPVTCQKFKSAQQVRELRLFVTTFPILICFTVTYYLTISRFNI